MHTKSLALTSLGAIVVAVMVVLAGISVGAHKTSTTHSSTHSTDAARNELRKADFGVQDAVCVVCLREIQSTLRHTKGVLKAESSMRFAYGFAVIYDRRKTSIDKILAPIKKKYTLFDVTDQPTLLTK